MTKAIFITGTDTDIGKTFVSCLLLNAFNAAGLKTFGVKPIASGCSKNKLGELKNQDALHLQACASIKQPYSTVNPIAFEAPIAPHIAAHNTNTYLSKQMVQQSIKQSIQAQADINLIEGAGGWSVPLNKTELFSDVILELNIPIVLVVGIKLGCLNHALLTYNNIIARGGTLIGWVANCVDPQNVSTQENIDTLKTWINAPCLGTIPHHCESIAHTDINIKIIQQQLL